MSTTTKKPALSNLAQKKQVIKDLNAVYRKAKHALSFEDVAGMSNNRPNANFTVMKECVALLKRIGGYDEMLGEEANKLDLD